MTNSNILHVRFGGRSLDVTFHQLDIGANFHDREIKRILSGYLGVDEALLLSYVVERHDNGNMTIRPEAIFG